MNPPTEIPMKQWVAEEAQRIHLSRGAVWYRLRKSPTVRYPGVVVRSVNKRVVFIQTPNRKEAS